MTDPTYTDLDPDLEDDESSSSTIPSQAGQASINSTSIWGSRRSQRRSWVWDHGDAIVDKVKRYWQCRLCKKNPKRYANGSTKHPIDYRGSRMHEVMG